MKCEECAAKLEELRSALGSIAADSPQVRDYIATYHANGHVQLDTDLVPGAARQLPR
jgi:hypothetical protein